MLRIPPAPRRSAPAQGPEGAVHAANRTSEFTQNAAAASPRGALTCDRVVALLGGPQDFKTKIWKHVNFANAKALLGRSMPLRISRTLLIFQEASVPGYT